MTISRRDFLRLSCCSAAAASFLSNIPNFGLVNAFAQTGAPDYKALVCVFLFGGNDGNNILIPNDTTGYANYASLRSGLALPQAQILPIQTASAKNLYGLHPQMGAFQQLWNAGKLAVVGNCGLLVQPTTRAQYLAKTVSVPANLFSHADQQNQFQTLVPLTGASSGWGGRAADKLQSLNSGSQYPAITSLAGSNIFCQGLATRPAAIIPGSTSGFRGLSGNTVADARNAAMQQLLTFDSGVSLVQAAGTTTGQAFSDSKILANALAGLTPLGTTFPTTSIGLQLQQVAKIMQARSSIGLSRQIFFCSIGGFDTHSDQINEQDLLFSQLVPAMKAFYDATVELSLDQKVTTFTLTEFGRTFQQAAGGGSDHAWGNHHLVMGGAVKGGELYGKLPVQALAGPDDAGNEGRWIPTTSLDQYAATMASWFGVSTTDLASIFPNLKNFAIQNLGFLG